MTNHDEEIYGAVQLDDLPEAYQGLIERLEDAGYDRGESIRISLLVGQELGGLFYLHKIDSAILSAKKRLALVWLQEGKSYADCARRCNFSEQTIRELQRDQHKAAMAKKQLKLFGGAGAQG